MDRRSAIVSAGILAGGIAIAALVFGLFFYKSRSVRDKITVTGSASEQFTADIVKWRVTLSRQIGEGEQQQGYAALRADAQRFVAALRAAGLPDSAINLAPVTAQPMWGPQGTRTGYNLQQPLFAISMQPSQIEPLALDPSRFLAGGATVEGSQLEYFYSRIAELKHSLLAKATQDAQKRAREIAGSTSASVGKMTSARAGVFQITEPFSTEVAAYGVHNTATKRKEITVTVHADFTLE